MSRRPFFAAPLLVLLVALTGCIEWEQQVLRYRHDPAADRLRVFQDYRGIYGADREDALTSAEKNQLKSVLETDRTFFFSNWILELNLASLRNLLIDLPFKAADSVAEEERNRELGILVEEFLKHVTIRNVGLYRDADGKLCGAQEVEIRNVSRLLPLAEAVIRAQYKLNAFKADGDADKQAFHDRVSRPGWKSIRLEGNQLNAAFPESKTAFDRNFKGAELDRLAKAGVHVRHEDGLVKVTIGKKKEKITRVASSPFRKGYRDNARKAADELAEVKAAMDTDALARKFLR